MYVCMYVRMYEHWVVSSSRDVVQSVHTCSLIVKVMPVSFSMLIHRTAIVLFYTAPYTVL